MKLFCWYLFLLEVLLLSQKGNTFHNFFGKVIPRKNTIDPGRIFGGLFRKNTRGGGRSSSGWRLPDIGKKISDLSNFTSNIFSSLTGRKSQTVTQDGDSQSWSRGALDVNMLKKWLGLPDSWIPPTGFNFQTFRIPLGKDRKPDVQALINILRLPTTYKLPLGFDINGKGLDFNVNVSGTSAKGGQRFKTFTLGQEGSGGDSQSWSRGALDVNMLKKWLRLPDSWIPPTGFNFQTFRIPLGNDGKPDVQALIKILRLPTTYTLPLGFDINGKGLDFNVNVSGTSAKGGQRFKTFTLGQEGSGGDPQSWSSGALDVNMLKKWLGLPDSWIPPPGFNFQTFSIPLGNDGKPDVQALINILRLPTTYTLPLGFDINGKGLDFNVNVSGTSPQGGQRYKTYTGGQVGSGGDSRSGSRGALDVNMLKKWLGLPDSWIPPPGFNFQTFSIPLGNDGNPDVQALINILRLPTTYTLPLGFDINGKGLDFNVNDSGTSAQGGQRFKTFTLGQEGSGGDPRSWSRGALDVNMLKKWLGLPDSWIPPPGFNFQAFSIPLDKDGNPDVQALINILRLPTTYTLPLGFDINGKGLDFNVNDSGTSAQGGQIYKTFTLGQEVSGGDPQSWSRGALDVNMLKKWLGLPDSWIPPPGFNFQTFSIPLGNDGKPDVQALINILRLPTTYTLPLGFDINGKGLDFNVNDSGTSAQGGQRYKTFTLSQEGSGGDPRSWSRGALDVNMLKKWLGLPDSWIPPPEFNFQTFSIPLVNDGNPDVQALINILRLPTTYTLPLGFDINGKGLDFNVKSSGKSAQGGQKFRTFTLGQEGSGGDSQSWSRGALDVNMLKKWLGLPDSWIPPPGFNFQTFSIPLVNDGKPDVQALIKILRLPTTYTLPLGFDINGKGLDFNVNVSGTSAKEGQRYKIYTGGQEGSGGDSQSWSRGALDVNMLKKWLGLPDSWIPPTGFNFQTFSIPLGNNGKPDVQALINILRLPTTYTLPLGFDINGKGLDFNVNVSGTSSQEGQRFKTFTLGQEGSGGDSQSWSRGALDVNMLKKWLGLPDSWIPPPGFNFQTFIIPLGNDGKPDVQALINILRLPTNYTLPPGFDMNNRDVGHNVTSRGTSVQGDLRDITYSGGQRASNVDSRLRSRKLLDANTLKKWLGLPNNCFPPPGFKFQTFLVPLDNDKKRDVQALFNTLGLSSTYILPLGFDINNTGENKNVTYSVNRFKRDQGFMSYLGGEGDSGSDSKSLSRGALNANTLKKWLGLPDNWTQPPGFNFQTFRIPLGKDGNPNVQALINTLGLPSSYTLPRGFDINDTDVNYNVSSSVNPVKGDQGFMSYLGEKGDSGSDSKSSRGALNANTLIQSEVRMMNSRSNPRFSSRRSGDFFSQGGPRYPRYYTSNDR
ncbi:UNVERIFIED_CONTAM: hypothetical protein RMT77_013580 [Armadillidium vulgare]